MSNNHSKGSIGRRIYPLRVIGYWLAIATILLAQWQYLGSISVVAWVFCTVILVYPHAAFAYYRWRHHQARAEQQILVIDMYLIGWIGALLFYSPALAAPFAIANSATNLSMGGVRLFLYGLLAYALGLGSAELVYGWHYQSSADTWLMLPAFIYLFAGSHYIGFLSFVYGSGLRSSKQLLSHRNRSIGESVAYAKRIQEAILPLQSQLTTIFPQSFVLLAPKDVVSGDFYWLAQMPDKIIVAVVDCTGHGITGAFMSLVSNNLLHQIVNLRGITRPDLILEELRGGIGKALRQHETNNQDGMEIGICSIDAHEGKPLPHGRLQFAGAGIALYWLQPEGKLHHLRADKIIIGGSARFGQSRFQLHEVALRPGLRFYLFSDGCTDQFGGPQRRKFGRRRMEDLLGQMQHLPMSEQGAALRQRLQAWQHEGKEKQIDDIAALGIDL